MLDKVRQQSPCVRCGVGGRQVKRCKSSFSDNGDWHADANTVSAVIVSRRQPARKRRAAYQLLCRAARRPGQADWTESASMAAIAWAVAACIDVAKRIPRRSYRR